MILNEYYRTFVGIKGLAPGVRQSRLNWNYWHPSISTQTLESQVESGRSRVLIGPAEMPLTQEFLSQMLGVRRTTVNYVASTLERQGLIESKRGKIQISDRDNLLRTACGCYGIVRSNIDAIIQTAHLAKTDQ